MKSLLRHSQNFDFLGLKNFLLQLKNQRFGSKIERGFFIILILKGSMTCYRQKVYAFC